MDYEYFRVEESEQFSFFRIPKALFTDKEFDGLSTDAKLLYGILLDRINLSKKNGWVDADGYVYIIYTVAELQEVLHISHTTVTKLLLVSGKSIRGNSLDDVPFMATLPIVHEALEKIVEAFPEFRYYPPKELNVHYYPDKMNADELAAAMNQLAEDFDYYDYQDSYNPEEDMVETIALELRCGYAHKYIPFLKDIIVEECGESLKAEELLKKLKAYQPEVLETAVPVVRINFCEDKEMNISGYKELGSLDETIAKMDAELAARVEPKTGMPEKTVQMYFTIYYPDRDKMQELQGKISIGDGYGGIVSQLKTQNEKKLQDESWLNYQKGKGEEAFQAYMADLTNIQEHVLPYLQSFCSLEEKAPEKVVKSTTLSKSDVEAGKTIASVGSEKTKTVQPPKKSIHERLKSNKEIIAKQQGKDNKEKGVELV